jgi:hypothetical protein
MTPTLTFRDALAGQRQPRNGNPAALHVVADTGSLPRVAGYHLLRKVGEGRLATVYLAQDIDGAEVALKMLRQAHSGNEVRSAAFAREFGIPAAIHNRHVVRVFEQCEFLDEALQAVVVRAARVHAHDLQHLRRPAVAGVGQKDRGHAALADLAQHPVAFHQQVAARMDGRRGAGERCAAGGALAPLLVGGDGLAQQLEHPRRRLRALARHQSGHFHDVDEAVVRQAERADPALLGPSCGGEAGGGGRRDAPVQVGGRDLEQARQFDGLAHRGHHALGAVGARRHLGGAQVDADRQGQRRQHRHVGLAADPVRQLNRLVDRQDGGVQATLRVVRLPGVGRVGEDGQDRVRAALGDLAAELDHRTGQHVPHVVDEGGEFGGRHRLAGGGEVVQPRIQEGRYSRGGPFAGPGFPRFHGGGAEVRHYRRGLGRDEFRGRLGFFERHA